MSWFGLSCQIRLIQETTYHSEWIIQLWSQFYHDALLWVIRDDWQNVSDVLWQRVKTISLTAICLSFLSPRIWNLWILMRRNMIRSRIYSKYSVEENHSWRAQANMFCIIYKILYNNVYIVFNNIKDILTYLNSIWVFTSP